MQDNRSFDKCFGTYPSANGISKNVCMSMNPDHPDGGRCVKPFLSTNPYFTRYASWISIINGCL
jgi:phospholipase C